jgi:hypothetical protein
MGYATPSFEGIYVKGNVANQFKQDLGLSEDTYFGISSLTKIFTAALCALVGARHQPKWQTQNIGNYLGKIRRLKIERPSSPPYFWRASEVVAAAFAAARTSTPFIRTL